MDFIDRLEGINGKPVAVFCTCKTAVGGMLDSMADRLVSRGADVTGGFKSRGPVAPDGFDGWLTSLGEGIVHDT